MATRPTKKKPAKPSVRKPAKPSVRKPAKPVSKKTARKPAVRKTAARKSTASVRRSAPVRRTAAPKRAPVARPSTPLVTPPQGINTGGTPAQPQQPLGSFYHQVEQPMATHTVKEGETLSDIALRYYGNGSERHYMHIFNANRVALSDGPHSIKAGQELSIPKPPAE